MNAFLSKLFGWHKYHVTDADKEVTSAAVVEAAQVRQLADALHTESIHVGARQRTIREENHWTKGLEAVFRGT
ncbi:hypothetical protein HYP71_gp029 [Arthrobacter phage KBurrousTX]|uniref:Uncharacterized protein n=1 Tax=Arthrobacter phage KBurrousTX TaxID=2315608 RepID=A0A386K8I6_9CAUD|nr:hypothetical protein HYP71_gp029 [Arthrobacter phage KBurrousTX]AYD81523.1 hypothetical protein KBurrousTX_29 [Arthrobacter phage KBurrousTX]